MRKMSLVMVLLMALTGIKAFAQRSKAQFRYYYTNGNGNVGFSITHKDRVDSIAFVTEDFDVYVSASPIIDDKAEWSLEVSTSYSFSVEALQVCIVPDTYSEEDILSAYHSGTLTDLRTLADTVRTAEFACGEGTFKPVAFGLDKEGNMRSHYVGTAINPIVAFQNEVTNPFKYGVGSYNYNWEDYHYAWGYGSLMLIRNLMDDCHTMVESGYNWYDSWMSNTGMSGKYASTYYVWQYFDNAIQKYTELINTLEVEGISTNKVAKQLLGSAIAFRALHYLDAARMYEYLPNDGTSSVNESGNDVLNLTYPIAYSKEFTEDSTKVLRRATKDEMAAYILNELNEAESWLEENVATDKELVGKEVIDGLKARLYMWTEDYARAMEFANKVISASNHSVLTESEWLDPQKGFNDSSVSSWMLALKYKQNDRTVTTGFINWASWCTNQAIFGYNFVGPYYMITTSAYDRMSDADFRKKSYKAPSTSKLWSQNTYPSGISADDLPTFAAIKFRPGQGNVSDYQVGAVLDIPLMRIEEMYFIMYEAMAQQGQLASTAEAFCAWMKQNRDSNYTLNVSSQAELIDEIIKQKNIEFWGEGLNYFDCKRLNKPVTRSYVGTNVPQGSRFNTTTRPAWMNFVFYNRAYNGQIEAWNNPDPSGCYTR